VRPTLQSNHVKTLNNYKNSKIQKIRPIKIYSQDSQKYSSINNKYSKNIRVETQYLTARWEKTKIFQLQKTGRPSFSSKILKENSQIKGNKMYR
jgi:hypothetical protein